MNEGKTLSETMNDLRKQGYTEDFNLQQHCIKSEVNNIELHPDDFVIDRVYRFDANTDPSDQAALYAISSEKHKMKGVLVNSYGIYSDDISDELIMKLKFHS